MNTFNKPADTEMIRLALEIRCCIGEDPLFTRLTSNYQNLCIHPKHLVTDVYVARSITPWPRHMLSRLMRPCYGSNDTFFLGLTRPGNNIYSEYIIFCKSEVPSSYPHCSTRYEAAPRTMVPHKKTWSWMRRESIVVK